MLVLRYSALLDSSSMTLASTGHLGGYFMTLLPKRRCRKLPQPYILCHRFLESSVGTLFCPLTLSL